MFDTISKAQSAYGQSRATVRSPRRIEYDAFAKVTSNIRAASDRGRLGFAELAEALHQNRQLWWIMASDVADQANALPDELRAQIFYLAEFTDQHTTKVLRNRDKADPLIEINTMIMRGLQGITEGIS